ncbi:50S ribosomal protein L30 [Candidatus Bathyarchaeota archaeon]|nr:50S ribosomal protein L30 [Candidatus Bathyarchaeota archaeon]
MLLVIRIRGGIDVPKKIEDTLMMLRVDRNNYATLIKNTPSYNGMLKKAKDYITWGEPTLDTIKTILEKRGKLVGDKKITNENLSQLGYPNIDNLAESITNGELDLTYMNGIKPFFRMHPPKKGFKRTVKRAYTDHGELGYRGEAINELALRMC